MKQASELLKTSSELSNMTSKLSNKVSELLNMSSELLKQMSEHFNWEPSSDSREVKVCRQDVRSSSKKF